MKFFIFGFWIVLVLLIALIILNLLGICPLCKKTPPPPTPDPDVIKKEIEAKYQSLSNLFADGDFEGIAGLYREGAVFAAPGKAMMRGKMNAENFWQNLKKAGVVDVQFKMFEFYLEGEVSYDLTEYHFIEESMEGKITNSTGNVLTVWRHRVECPREIEVQNFNMLKEEKAEEEVQ
jgi:ketosteroid isomerase-like protein